MLEHNDDQQITTDATTEAVGFLRMALDALAFGQLELAAVAADAAAECLDAIAAHTPPPHQRD